ncbi:hypothetical protein MTAT_19130 [Moorella thermoacetica]|uniref:Uncharacterized protein n=1 Tax=Neomoorella thermoacetica TaxID=1525 RepID=A0AAC9MV87_NEOTH|nr:hypothetical protein [Moorella thermoacetica]AOQ24570.1 hypothetical protein Maut_02140 [Moorella thermoacetica]TYL12671.1 hypothetical protein MTAT_19130 [Moorella thermoacetica]
MLCPKIHSCRNSAYCATCENQSMYKSVEKPKPKLKTGKKKKKEGIAFEDKVAKTYNKIAQNIAKRRPGSGAVWYKPGDVVTPDILMEAKERGTVTAKGEKSISIKKDWLEKIERESWAAGKTFWCLPFHYKGDDRIYVVIDFEDLVTLVEDQKYIQLPETS